MHYIYVHIYIYSHGSYLDKHGEVDDSDGGGNEHGLQRHVFRIYEEHQGECYGATQTAVGHHEFLHFVQFMQPELVRQCREHYYACNRKSNTITVVIAPKTLFRVICCDAILKKPDEITYR